MRVGSRIFVTFFPKPWIKLLEIITQQVVSGISLYLMLLSPQRILEYEQKLKVKGKVIKVEVELWDVSGDKKFEACWPAIFKGSHGIVFVYNPDNSNHEKELNEWQVFNS
uniref:Uncharacterized protein n=1 Tax=Trichobilharzia regenti TaxID=157069 RepID=A0AA85KGX7_TRIRE|nr:unnamed protein product [Trichobilharzia regenti]